jgi:hypothetical protein
MKNTNFNRNLLLGVILLLPCLAMASKDSLRTNSGTSNIPVSKGWIPVHIVEAPAEATASATPVTITYRVQILALQHPIDVQSVKINGVDGKIYSTKSSDLTRYYMGEFTDLGTANQCREKLVQNGFEDACIVAYKNGERITIKESLSILGGK